MFLEFYSIVRYFYNLFIFFIEAAKVRCRDIF